MNKAYSWLSCPVLSVCVAGQGLGKCWGVSFTPSPCAEWKSWTMKQRDELWVSRKGVRIILRQMAHLGPEATLAVYVSHWGHVIHIRTWCPRSESVSVRCTPSAVPEHSCRHAWDPVYNPLTNLRSHMAPVWWSSHSLYAYIYIYIYSLASQTVHELYSLESHIWESWIQSFVVQTVPARYWPY